MLTLFFAVFAQSLFATTQIISVDDRTVSSIQEVSTDNSTFRVFAGLSRVDDCDSPNADETCNSCNYSAATLANMAPCNPRAVHNALVFRVNIQTDASTAAVALMKVKGSSDDNDILVKKVTSGVSANSEIEISETWGTICGKENGTTNSCSSDKFTLKVGFATSGSEDFLETAQEIEVVIINLASSDTNHDDCFASGTANVDGGFCQFEVSPGDEKVVVDNLPSGQKFSINGGTDTTQDLGAVRFYCKPVSNEFCSGSTVDASSVSLANSFTDIHLTNDSCFRRTFEVDDNGDIPNFPGTLTIDSGPGGENFINGQCYGFIMASEDLAGNIAYFTNSTFYTANHPTRKLVASPAEVTGLIGDEKCAAITFLGRGWKIQALRKLRDALPFREGLVRLYYQLSTPLVENLQNVRGISLLFEILFFPFVLLGLLIQYPAAFGLLLLFGFAWISTRRRANAY